MHGLPEQMYCSQQIHIPSMFPYILRHYAKAAIKTQPTDLLRWSSAYFRALSLNLQAPVKKRLEYPEPKNYKGLTPGFLKVLLKQFGKNPQLTVPYSNLVYRWDGICLKNNDLVTILLTGGFVNPDSIPWYEFIAVCAGYLTETFTETMILLCNILTEEPDGGNARISIDVFLKLYKFLATLDCSGTRYALNTMFFLPFQIKEVKSVSPALSRISTIPDEFKHFIQQSQEEGSGGSRASIVSSGGFEIPIVEEEDEEENIQKEESFQIDEIDAEEGIEEEEEEAEIILDKEIIDSAHEDAPLYEKGSEMTVEPEDTFHLKLPDEYRIEDTEVPPPMRAVESSKQTTLLSDMPDSSAQVIIKKATKKFHLNKYLADNQSIVTEVMSQFTTTGLPSDTITIYKPTAEKIRSLAVEEEERRNAPIKYHITEVNGIGPIVDKKTMEYFIEYAKERAKAQHGMIMPRNILNFQCPPLENFEYIKQQLKMQQEKEIKFKGCDNVY